MTRILFFKCLLDVGVFLKKPQDISSYHLKIAVDTWLSGGVKKPL